MADPILNSEQSEDQLAQAMIEKAIYFSMQKLTAESGLTPAWHVEHWAKEQPTNPAIVSREGNYTYQEFDRMGNRVANALARLGAKAHESVALIMDSRPEFLFSVLGAGKLGIVTGLINTNLMGEQLKHALSICQSKWIIVGSEHVAVLRSVQNTLGIPLEHVLVWPERGARNEWAGAQDFATLVASASDAQPDEPAAYDMKNPFVYICTSGTTGMPKAALVRNQRFLQACYYFGQAVLGVQSKDVMYTAGLPLYHNTAISQAWGVALTGGGAVALRRKFSASQFWDDCVDLGVTMFTYVGEVCRYLVSAPVHAQENTHKLRSLLGAGLRPDIWHAFRERFQIPQVFEYYGATEGNVGLINLSGKPGMVGRISPQRGHVLAKVDPETEELVHENGKLVPAQVGESGMLIAKIGPMAEFEGYVDKTKNSSKILENPFGEGDRYFNTGDVLTLHEGNWVSFADRLGDTFRWKGENVSTNDVQESVSKAPGVREAVCYGVKVSGTDGRAGMVAITVDENFDVQKLAAHVTQSLPAYARPLFVRVEQSLQMTGSYKYVKTALKTEGFDPTKIKSPLYFLQADRYAPLVSTLFEEIAGGKLRL